MEDTTLKKNRNQDFIPVRIDTLGENDLIDFDLYSFEANRYFLFCSANSNFKKSDLSQTYIKRTKFLYIKNSQKKNYRNYVEKHLPELLSNEKLETEEKVNLIYDVSNSMTIDVFSDYKLPKQERVATLVDNIVDFMFNKNVGLKQLIQFAEHDFYTYNHSLHVFIYTTMFASFLGLKDEKILASLSQGAFLHDIGKSRIGLEIINKPGPLNKEEWNKMKLHPVYGFDIVKNEMKIDDDILLSVILRHHERLNGEGYPHGTKKLSFYDKIIGIADTYDALTSNRSYQASKGAFNALKYMIQTQSERLDLNLLNKFAIMLGSK